MADEPAAPPNFTPRKIERILRRGGVPSSLAKGIIATGLGPARSQQRWDWDAVLELLDSVKENVAELTRLMKEKENRDE